MLKNICKQIACFLNKYKYHAFCLIAGGVIVAVIFTAFNGSNNNTNDTDSDYSSSQNSQISFYYGSSENEITVDVLDEVEKNTLNNDNFTDSDGLKYYTENGEKVSKIGIDVSEFQGDIDWAKVKEQGIEFAMIRAGFRGYTEGGLFTDTKFEYNISEALKNGIEVGVYFFSQAINEKEAVEEAEYTMNLIKDHDITYPVVFDWEHITADDARARNLSPESVNKCAQAFCKAVKDKGYDPMIYYNEYFGYTLYDLSKFTDYKTWYVEYSDTPDFYYAFDMWQYSESGTVNGIEGSVDLNVYFPQE